MADAVTRAVEILNDALERDPQAMTRLINLRVDCNDRLAAHRTILAAGLEGGGHELGVLGLINGILGQSPTGVIGARGRREGGEGRFVRIKKFVDLRDEKLDVIA